MIRTILSLILLTQTTLSQFMDSIKPDMSFNDNNDRFDITSMMRAQKFDTPLVDDDNKGEASDIDFRRYLKNDDTAFLDILQQKRPDTRRGEEVDLAYDPDNLPKIRRALDDDMLDLEFQENLKLFANNIAKPGRRNAPDDDHKGEALMPIKPQGTDPLQVDDSGFAIDDRFNSFEGGTVSDFEENLKKFMTTKPPTESTPNDFEEIPETGILLQNAPAVVNVDN